MQDVSFQDHRHWSWLRDRAENEPADRRLEPVVEHASIEE